MSKATQHKRRKDAGRKPANDFVDPTPERHEQSGGLVRNPRIQTEAGIVTHEGYAARHESLIDKLDDKQQLGAPADYELEELGQESPLSRRREAAEWLKSQMFRAGIMPKVVIDLHGRGGSGEVSDEQDAAHSVYLMALRAIHPYDGIVVSVACHDEWPRFTSGPVHARIYHLWRGLDRLADYRGIG